MTFGQLSFKQQVQAVQGVAVLTGLSGSDLSNMVFLPGAPLTQQLPVFAVTLSSPTAAERGALVELLPQVAGHQVAVPSPALWLSLHLPLPEAEK